MVCKKKFRERENKKLLEEIEKDFQEEFDIKQKVSSDDSSRFKDLIEWIEDEQLKDEIKKRL